MAKLKQIFYAVLGALVFVGMGWAIVAYYPYIFAKNITGVVEKVERVDMNLALLNPQSGEKINPQLHTYAVAIKTSTGEIATASSEDNRWAVATPGQCVEAKFLPYPPWNLVRNGTYFGARLVKLSVCPTGN